MPVVTFLRTLPLPPTHPSHPAAPAIQATLKEAQKGYADMRGAWGRKCLEQYGRRVVDRAETLDGVAAGQEFGAWLDNMLSVAEVTDLHAGVASTSDYSIDRVRFIDGIGTSPESSGSRDDVLNTDNTSHWSILINPLVAWVTYQEISTQVRVLGTVHLLPSVRIASTMGRSDVQALRP